MYKSCTLSPYFENQKVRQIDLLVTRTSYCRTFPISTNHVFIDIFSFDGVMFLLWGVTKYYATPQKPKIPILWHTPKKHPEDLHAKNRHDVVHRSTIFITTKTVTRSTIFITTKYRAHVSKNDSPNTLIAKNALNSPQHDVYNQEHVQTTLTTTRNYSHGSTNGF